MLFLQRLYKNTFFRIPFKFTISFIISKLVYDFLHIQGMGLEFGLMRTNDIYSGQNPINPPVPKPYPQSDTYQRLLQIKAYNQYIRSMIETMRCRQNFQINMYNNHPCRQNPDSIDNFIQFGNIHRIKQIINYSFINQLKKQGIDIPEGINQKIRKLCQYKLDFHVPIIPQL